MRRSTAIKLLALAPLAILGASAFSGCGCAPEDIRLDVELELVSEEIRTLPILASGVNRVAGMDLDIPDSHGVLEWDVSFSNDRAWYVDVREFQLEVVIEGSPVPTRIVRVEADDVTFRGRLENHQRLRIWWTVDKNQVSPAELSLNEGDGYEATLSFAWSLNDCFYTASGMSEAVNQAFVQPSIITTTFEQTSGTVSKSGATAGYEAQAHVKNGITTTIQDVTGIAVALGSTPGTVVWTESVVTVNGLPVSTAGPGDEVVFRGSPLPTSGTAPWLLILYVDHDSTSGPGPERDILAWFK